MDRERMAEGIRRFLEGLGREQGFPGDDIERTPDRAAEAWCEDLVSGYALDPSKILTWTEAPHGAGTVLVRDISIASVCVHHLLPFLGRAHVAYLPDSRLAGLSKIGRVLDAHARRLQTQEHLTASVVRTLDTVLKPRGVLVVVEAEHTCMTVRGVRKEQARMITVECAGRFAEDAAERSAVLELLTRGRTAR
jgi:GTP cyclohydrolase I